VSLAWQIPQHVGLTRHRVGNVVSAASGFPDEFVDRGVSDRTSLACCVCADAMGSLKELLSARGCAPQSCERPCAHRFWEHDATVKA